VLCWGLTHSTCVWLQGCFEEYTNYLMSWQSFTRVMYSIITWGLGVLTKFQLFLPPSSLTYTDEWTRWGLEPTAERGSNKGMFPLIFLDVMWEIHISSTSQVRNPYYLLQLACITESQKQTCYSLWQYIVYRLSVAFQSRSRVWIFDQSNWEYVTNQMAAILLTWATTWLWAFFSKS